MNGSLSMASMQLYLKGHFPKPTADGRITGVAKVSWTTLVTDVLSHCGKNQLSN